MIDVTKQRVKISPVAKNCKTENLDIKSLLGTGPGGRITKVDVLKALEERVAISENEQEESKVVPVTGMRKQLRIVCMQAYKIVRN